MSRGVGYKTLRLKLATMLRNPLIDGTVQWINKVYVKVDSFHKNLYESSQALFSAIGNK